MSDKIIDKEIVMKQINQELLKNLENYRKTLNVWAADISIEALCLDKPTEKILLDHGFDRVYTLFNCNFTEIKGLGKTRIDRLTSRLNEFFAMC